MIYNTPSPIVPYLKNPYLYGFLCLGSVQSVSLCIDIIAHKILRTEEQNSIASYSITLSSKFVAVAVTSTLLAPSISTLVLCATITLIYDIVRKTSAEVERNTRIESLLKIL